MDTSLKIIKQKLQNILTRLEWKAENITNNQGQTNTTKLSGLHNIRKIINEIGNLNLFSSVVISLENSAIFTSSNDQMTIQIQEAKGIIADLTLLETLCNNFLNVLTISVPEEDMNSINIKLPQVNDFDELSKVSREIHLGLTQVIFNDDINGQTKIVSVENGSIWFNVFVGASAVSVIASLIWSSAVIY